MLILFGIMLRIGKNGIDVILHLIHQDLKVKIAAEVKDFDPENLYDKKEAKEWIDLLNLL